MKGIILAGGSGTRLWPITRAVSKQLLPIYDKPMVYYPLSTLMLAGIKEFLLISTPHDLPMYEKLLGDGKELGITIQYKVQPNPGGLAQAFILGREFVGRDSVALVLGDNIFHGMGLAELLQRSVRENHGATIFGYWVKDPERYGVAVFGQDGELTGIEEKPKQPKSNYAIVGIYVYDNQVLDIAANLKPSARGELEITDVNNEYLRRKQLKLVRLRRGTAWLDTGTHESLLDASNFIAVIERRQGLKVACLEEVAWRMGFIDDKQLLKLADLYKGEYRDYLLQIAQRGQ